MITRAAANSGLAAIRPHAATLLAWRSASLIAFNRSRSCLRMADLLLSLMGARVLSRRSPLGLIVTRAYVRLTFSQSVEPLTDFALIPSVRRLIVYNIHSEIILFDKSTLKIMSVFVSLPMPQLGRTPVMRVP